jgi:hypothetical protein
MIIYPLKFFFISGIILFIIASFPEEISAQGFVTSQDSLESETNTITLSADKLYGNYLFLGLANINLTGDFGTLDIFNRYVGDAYLSFNNAFRDDEDLFINYSYPLTGNLGITAAQNWSLSSDTRSLELNKVEIFNLIGGLKYNVSANSYFDALAGFERNTQLGILNSGPYYSLKGRLNGLYLDDYIVSGSLNSYYSNLDNTRRNHNLDINMNIVGNFESESSLDLFLFYKNSNSANYFKFQTSDIYALNVENRALSHLITNLGLKFRLLGLENELEMSVSDRYEDKTYNDYYQSSPETGVSKIYHLSDLSFRGTTQYSGKTFFQKFSLSFGMRNDDYSLDNTSNIDDTQFNSLSSIENNKDVSTGITTLISETILRVSQLDSLFANFLFSILRSDTPSDQNYDDYDELLVLGGIRYERRLSRIFNAGILFRTHQQHTVNLKSQVSAQNRWFRSYSLSPYFFLRVKDFFYSPRFEVLANYTIYDYDELFSQKNSKSFRQISYRDSLRFRLAGDLFIRTQVHLIYNETGILYWNEFAETPKKNYFEQLYRLMFVTLFDGKYETGIGVRYYKLSQSDLVPFERVLFNNWIYGPEAMLRAKALKRAEVIFDGRLDFQALGGKYSITPNFTIMAKLGF